MIFSSNRNRNRLDEPCNHPMSRTKGLCEHWMSMSGTLYTLVDNELMIHHAAPHLAYTQGFLEIC